MSETLKGALVRGYNEHREGCACRRCETARNELHAVRDAYGGDPNDPAWNTPEGIAGIIEELSGLARAMAAKAAMVAGELDEHGAELNRCRDIANEDARQLLDARTEVERLREWKDSAMAVLSEWDAVHAALGSPGELGKSKAVAAKREVKDLQDWVNRINPNLHARDLIEIDRTMRDRVWPAQDPRLLRIRAVAAEMERFAATREPAA